MKLSDVGWTLEMEQNFTPWKEKGKPARVISEQKNLYQVVCDLGEMEAQVSGKMMYDGFSRSCYPAVGDWVVVTQPSKHSPCVIQAILPRKSQFERKMAGRKTDIQIIATNIDYAFIVSAFDHDFNLRRIERYLTLAFESGANPVIVLNKVDQCEDRDRTIEMVRAISMGCPILPISCFSGEGFDQLREYTGKGKTIALLGSSGVGKSSLINYLLGNQVQKTNTVRESDDHGRHTTTYRQLFVLPSGGAVIDTPGMRELQMSGSPVALEDSFEDITTLAMACKFVDCKHHHEPGCAVREAIEEGTLEPGRLISYQKLQKELRFFAQKNNRLNNDKNQKLKMIAKWRRQLKK